jgi:uncharacterized protein (TIGR02453 family)
MTTVAVARRWAHRNHQEARKGPGRMRQDETARFPPGFFRFLKELAKHNDRDWFQANKPRYEAEVLGPAVRFVAAVGPEVERISSEIEWNAKPFGGSISRIYRDTRFAKDKSPYRTNVGIHFGHRGSKGEKGEHLPGFYLHLAPGESTVHSGVWHPDPSALARIRAAIDSDQKGWAKVRKAAAPDGGEMYARVPAGFAPDHPFAEDLRRKDFFASLPFSDAEVTAATFPGRFVTACRTIDPLNAFLAKGMRVPW